MQSHIHRHERRRIGDGISPSVCLRFSLPLFLSLSPSVCPSVQRVSHFADSPPLISSSAPLLLFSSDDSGCKAITWQHLPRALLASDTLARTRSLVRYFSQSKLTLKHKTNLAGTLSENEREKWASDCRRLPAAAAVLPLFSLCSSSCSRSPPQHRSCGSRPLNSLICLFDQAIEGSEQRP